MARFASTWLDTVLHLYAERILPIDLAVARRIGTLTDHARGQGHDPGLADVAIAATAMARGCTVLTRNLRHFAPLGVAVIDPYAGLPPDGVAGTPEQGTATAHPDRRSPP